MNYQGHVLSRKGLELEYFLVPWDTEAFGFPVAQIQRLVLRDPEAHEDFEVFQAWLDQSNVRLVSCRLGHDQLLASMFLEERGFRFIEMVHHPELDIVQDTSYPNEGINVLPADAADQSAIEEIAGSAFKHGRFHQDWRLPRGLGEKRYQFWVRNSMRGGGQQVLKLISEERIMGFFIVELLPELCCYWHLTAIAPAFQGQGLGKHAWRAVVSYCRDWGARSIRTRITASNIPVLNLYARLGFRFVESEITLHWWRDSMPSK